MLISALKYNAILFFLYFVTINPLVFWVIIPAYIILLYVYYAFLNVCTKYGYKMYMLIFVSVIFNIISFIVARSLFKLTAMLLKIN